MNRLAFKMRLKPGAEAHYSAVHDAIWPEMVALIHDSGIRNYSIFRDGLDLFAYCELTEAPTTLSRADAVMARWWDELEPYMEYTPDHSPRTWPLVEVFHQD